MDRFSTSLEAVGLTGGVGIDSGRFDGSGQFSAGTDRALVSANEFSCHFSWKRWRCPSCLLVSCFNGAVLYCREFFFPVGKASLLCRFARNACLRVVLAAWRKKKNVLLPFGLRCLHCRNDVIYSTMIGSLLCSAKTKCFTLRWESYFLLELLLFLHSISGESEPCSFFLKSLVS